MQKLIVEKLSKLCVLYFVMYALLCVVRASRESEIEYRDVVCSANCVATHGVVSICKRTELTAC